MKTRYVLSVISLCFSLVTTPAFAEAYTIAPKVGQCFMHTMADVSASNPQKNPIPCSKAHNAEIFQMSQWPSKTAPDQMAEKDAWNLADSICGFKAGASALNRSKFNYWAWYTPDKKAWGKGERWLRCDGMYISNAATAKEFSQYKFQTWTGRRS